jgi:hypothetical protein
LSEHPERHEPEYDPDRDLEPGEAGFYGTGRHDHHDEPESTRPRDPLPEHEPRETAAAATDAPAHDGVGAGESASHLFATDQADSLRARWDRIQTEFVDQPRAAVEKADTLVGDVMQRLADGFSQERTRLEREWDRGDSVSTEDLRVALKRYRTFFDRLLSV